LRVDTPGLDDVRRLVAAHLRGYRAEAVVPLGEGQDNVAFEVGGELIVRFGKEPDPDARSARVDREGRLLAVVAAVSGLPVPEPVFVDPAAGCLAYRRLPGRPLLGLPAGRRAQGCRPVAAALGGLLAALHAVPAERVAALVDVDDQPLPGWLREAAELYDALGSAVPDRYRPAVARFLADPPPEPHPGPLVFSHNDLGIEHVLVDPQTLAVTGILDWTDAAMVDPAYDFGLLHRDLGPVAVSAALDAYPSSTVDSGTGLRDRALFYARCSALEDLAYGLDSGERRYATQSLLAMDWLFTD
jgi:aminoglycoside phosphotransferase (APT) family kinase protein